MCLEVSASVHMSVHMPKIFLQKSVLVSKKSNTPTIFRKTLIKLRHQRTIENEARENNRIIKYILCYRRVGNKRRSDRPSLFIQSFLSFLHSFVSLANLWTPPSSKYKYILLIHSLFENIGEH